MFLQVEKMFAAVALSEDWNDGSGPVHLVSHIQKVFDHFQKEEEIVHRYISPCVRTC